MLKLKLQYFGHMMQRIGSLEKPWFWERLKAGEGDGRGWDGWLASLAQGTRVWKNSGREWRTDKPGRAAVHKIAKNWTWVSNWSRAWLSDFTFTFHSHALEKEMAPHSSVLAWRIPGMGEPGGLPSMGSHRVGHDWSDLAAAAAAAEQLNNNKFLIKLLSPLLEISDPILRQGSWVTVYFSDTHNNPWAKNHPGISWENCIKKVRRLKKCNQISPALYLIMQL